MSERQEKYKNEGKTNELRKQRKEMAIELRKSKQEDKFSKRRFLEEELLLPPISMKAESMDELKQVLTAIQGNNQGRLEENVSIVRKSLTVPNPPIEVVIQSGALPTLLQCLTYSASPTLQYETAWVFTNIASGDSRQTRILVELGVVPILIGLLQSNVLQTKNQALWALGNISGDCAELRDLCVDCGIVQPLLCLISADSELSTLRICSWTVSNLCRYKRPPPRIEVVQTLLPYIKSLLCMHDSNVVSDALWAVLYIGDAYDKQINIIVDIGMVPILATLLGTENKDFVPQVLRIMGNISYMDDVRYSQLLIDNNVLPIINRLMTSPSLSTRKDAVWVISNIAANCQAHIGHLIESGCIATVYERMKNDKVKVKVEALWVLKNIFADGSHEQCMFIMGFEGFTKLIGDLMIIPDRNLQLSVLECTFSLLRASRAVGNFDQFYTEFEQLGLLDSLEDLQNSNFRNVANFAAEIVSEYFDGHYSEDELPMEDSVF